MALWTVPSLSGIHCIAFLSASEFSRVGIVASFPEGDMSNATPSPARPQLTWEEPVEVAILETDPENLSRRIQDAQDGIMDEIEDSFQTASSSERQSLVNAMNAVRELRRVSGNPG